jgi:hypothetical protein
MTDSFPTEKDKIYKPVSAYYTMMDLLLLLQELRRELRMANFISKKVSSHSRNMNLAV